MEILYVVVAAVAAVALLLWLAGGVKVVRQWERGVLFRFGRLVGIRDPGLNFIVPLVDRLIRVDTRILTVILEPQEVITKDNVTIKVDAVVYFRVVDATKAVVNVENFVSASTQIALTTLRSVIGESELDELLAHRARINQRLRQIVDEQTEESWGVLVTVAEVKDVLLPEGMQRAMARQAEAEREKRAKIVHAEGERLSADGLAQAAKILSADSGAAIHLRYLQGMVEMAGERNSTIIPIPFDILGIARQLRPEP